MLNRPAGATREAEPLRTWVLTHHYPSPLEPNRGTFVRALVRQWVASAPERIRLAVLAPEAIYSRSAGGFRRDRRAPASATEPELVRPVFPSFSAQRLGAFSTAWLTLRSFAWAAKRGAPQLSFDPELIYAHFLFPAAWTASRMAARRGVPVVAAIGESDLDTWETHFGRDELSATARAMHGLVCVSETNREACLALGVDDRRILVAPNAVDVDLFSPGDRERARQRLGLPQDRPIVAFTGHFVERKGPLRLLEALRSRPDTGAVFIGAGAQRPEGDPVLFAGPQQHGQVVEWLRAADLFVLPTLAEGSPNAVLEAMACGLPIVSSDIPALRETVPPEAGRLVDPLDVPALAAAIGALLDDADLRRSMGRAGRARAESFSLENRADRILGWLRGLAATTASGQGT